MCDLCRAEAIIRQKTYPKMARNLRVQRVEVEGKRGYIAGFPGKPAMVYATGASTDDALAAFDVEIDRFVERLKGAGLWFEPGDKDYE